MQNNTVRLALALLPLTLFAQQVRLGEVNERVASKTNPKHSYALLLPSNYDVAKKWPVVFVFDPGGRAGTAIELFRAGSEKYGYIVMCSWNSRNGAWDQTVEAMQTMYNDATQMFSIDEKRLYTSGYSGGARAALTFASNTGVLAGVLVGGAGYASASPSKVPYAVFLTTSTEDFNWSEMHTLNRHLEKVKATHRMTVVDGPHRWPPAATVTDGLEWLTMQAMRAALLEKNNALIAEFEKRHVDEIAKLGDDPLAQMRALQMLVADLDGMRDTAAWKSKADQLQKSKEVKQALKREQDEERRQLLAVVEFDGLVKAVDESSEGMEPARRWLARYAKDAKAEEDSASRRFARRLVSGISAQLYEGRQALQQQKKLPALARRLELASEFMTARFNVLLELAGTYAAIGDKKAAFATLERAEKMDRIDAAALDRAASLEPLRKDPRYEQLKQRLSVK